MQVSGGPPERPADRAQARAVRILQAEELSRIRAVALAWRNGLGALLAGLVGFGLLKGRSDVTQLQPGFAILAGALLLTALATGVIAAGLLMRAAHGLPYFVALRRRSQIADPLLATRDAETTASERALFAGVLAAVACMALLTAAVAVTWYGPAKKRPQVVVTVTGGEQICGEVVPSPPGSVTLSTGAGSKTISIATVIRLTIVDTCPQPTP